MLPADGEEVTVVSFGGVVVPGILKLLGDSAAAIGPECARGDHTNCRDLLGKESHAWLAFVNDGQEGIYWARGWDTDAAKALAVKAALAAV